MRGRDTSGLPAADATNAAIDTAQQVYHGHFPQSGHLQQVMPSHQCCLAHLYTALERQDLSRTYLAHHELESIVITIVLIINVANSHCQYGLCFCLPQVRSLLFQSLFLLLSCNLQQDLTLPHSF